MSDVKLSLYPTRAYDASSVMRLMLSDANYRKRTPGLNNIIAAVEGINKYFDTHAPSVTKVMDGPFTKPNLKMER